MRASSSSSEQQLLFVIVCGLLLLRSTGSRCVAAIVAAHRLSSRGTKAKLLHGMWNLPGVGMESMAPALAGVFSFTVPQGKSSSGNLFNYYAWLLLKHSDLIDKQYYLGIGILQNFPCD